VLNGVGAGLVLAESLPFRVIVKGLYDFPDLLALLRQVPLQPLGEDHLPDPEHAAPARIRVILLLAAAFKLFQLREVLSVSESDRLFEQLVDLIEFLFTAFAIKFYGFAQKKNLLVLFLIELVPLEHSCH